ncbi:MAG: alanine racemase [Deltaproteobacteria bacterium]|nr:alanine racemase [Deltaproteobacteria bacterium]
MGRPTLAEVDLNALRFNLEQLVKLGGGQADILAIVKADAYGHGAGPVARALQAGGARIFGVATVEEGLELRREGISQPILVLAGIGPGELVDGLRGGLTPAVGDLDGACRLDSEAGRACRPVSVHLKVDTGMNRLGISWRDWEAAIGLLRGWEKLQIEGIMSHLAVAESDHPEDRIFTQEQIRRFRLCLEQAHQAGVRPRYVHLANSAAFALWEETRFNLARPGLMLYGVHPAPALQGRVLLRPVLRWITKIASLKRVPAGDCISYGRTFSCSREALIAMLPVGYADGFSRLLSNRGEVLVRGRRARVAGVVCMDLTMVDVTQIHGVQTGDEVVLLGRQGEEEISAAEMAGWLGTIPYEVLCGIGKRVPRRYLGGEVAK